MAKTFYDIFEVDISATPDQIRIAYKRMVQRHHPDKHRGQASSEELLKAINYAYSVLSDARKRASYDSKLAGSANGVGDAYVYTGEASVNGSTGAQAAAAAAARDAVSAAVAARPFATRDPDWSRASHINSWLALGMLILLFLATSRFFSRAATGVLSTTEPSSTTLFYGIMVGTVIAAAVVWLVGKVVAYALPLAWPMNLIFRAKVRSDLNPEQRRIASAVLVMGILLTFAVPDLDRQNELATTAMATAPVAAQSPRKNTTVLPEPEPAAPVILAQNAPLARPSDAVEPRNIVVPAPPLPITTKPKVIVAESPPAPIKAVAPLPSPRVMAETKIHNPPVPSPPALTRAVPAAQARNMVPAPVTTVKPQPVPAPIVATARVKPVEPAKPAAQKTPLAAALPARTVATAPAVIPPPQSEKKMVLPTPPPEPRPLTATLDKSAATPPALALVTPESTKPGSATPPTKNVTEKKEAPALQNNTALVEEGDPTLASHRKRAQQGAADAQYQLGRVYEKGDGVARDYGQAEAWYRKAANHGYGPAQYSLGSMYMLGKGVTMDPVSAYVWLSLAVNNNISPAQQPMDYLADTLTPEQLADAKRKVAKWSPQRKR